MRLYSLHCADVAELVDAPDLGSGSARSEGSSPFIRIKQVIMTLSFGECLESIDFRNLPPVLGLHPCQRSVCDRSFLNGHWQD